MTLNKGGASRGAEAKASAHPKTVAFRLPDANDAAVGVVVRDE
jgi:hypothetical protein